MKKLYCDCCAEEIDDNLSNIFNADSSFDSAETPVFPIRIEISIINYKFNTTDKHFCKDCKLNAIRCAIAKL